MTSIAHLSDTHFGTEVPRVAAALMRSLDALQPDLVVVSGDITQRARRAEFDAASAYFSRLPAPVLVVPGNHDIPLYDVFSRVLQPYRNFRRAFGEPSGVWRGARATVLGLDTTLPARHTRGKVDAREFARLAGQAGDGQEILLAAVHQPLHAAWMQDRDEVLLNAHDAALMFAHGQVDLVLSGHVHVPVITTTRAIFPGLPRHFILVGAGTAISHRTRPGAPNSFNLLRLKEGIEICPFRYEEDSDNFACPGVFRFSRQQDGWKEECRQESN